MIGDRIETQFAAVHCRLLAQSGQTNRHRVCPLSGVKRTCAEYAAMSAFDPKRTSARIQCARLHHAAAEIHHPSRRRGSGLAASPRAGSSRASGVRRIGVLVNTTSDEPEGHARMAAFLQGLHQARAGRSAVMCGSKPAGAGATRARLRKDAADLVALNPDVILAGTGATTPALLQASPHRADRVRAGDPLRSAPALDRKPGAARRQRHRFPSSSTTNLSGKWLELLKEVAPQVKRVGVVRHR